MNKLKICSIHDFPLVYQNKKKCKLCIHIETEEWNNRNVKK
jgi:hypothetical protein